MASTYSVSSFAGLVSSIRRWQRPLNSRGGAKTQAQCLGVSDVKVAVRFGWKAGDRHGVLSALNVVSYDLADEVEFLRFLAGIACCVVAHRMCRNVW